MESLSIQFANSVFMCISLGKENVIAWINSATTSCIPVSVDTRQSDCNMVQKYVAMEILNIQFLAGEFKWDTW